MQQATLANETATVADVSNVCSTLLQVHMACLGYPGPGNRTGDCTPHCPICLLLAALFAPGFLEE